eukprot:m.181948 g.181948  ORF g.181948 m.181948 type:complete len:134 (-) comp21496_c0_seq3:209-610(-)
MPSKYEKIRLKIASYLRTDMTDTAIAKECGSSPATVARVRKLVEEDCTLKDKPRSGRPHRLTPRDERRLCLASKKLPSGSGGTAAALVREFRTADGQRVSRQTAIRTLKKHHLRLHTKRKRAVHSKKNKRKRS